MGPAGLCAANTGRNSDPSPNRPKTGKSHILGGRADAKTPQEPF